MCFLQPEMAFFGGSGTLIGQINRFREGFGPRKAIFSEFRLRTEFGGAGGRIWSICSSFGLSLQPEIASEGGSGLFGTKKVHNREGLHIRL